jgi:putative ABC transport system permease protein
MLTATRAAYADPDAVSGGWDIHAQSSLPPRDLRADLSASGVISADAFTAIGGAAPLLAEGIQIESSAAARWAPVSLVVADDGFVRGARAPLVGGSAEWRDLARRGTAIVGAGVLRGTPNRLRVEVGEGRDFRTVVLWLRDTRRAQPAVRVEVIGLADARGPFGSSVVVSAATLDGWPPPDNAGYFLSVPASANARELAAGLNLAVPDVKANTIGDEVRLVQGVRGLLNLILQGFMGVGLLAGVAALGTLSTRAVVERRRQIGVLRALGFTARAVSLGLLVESAVVALGGAALGVGVGLFVAQSTVTFLRLSRLNAELVFSIPWDQLALLVAVALGAALLVTAVPARQAARLTPAEALREA